MPGVGTGVGPAEGGRVDTGLPGAMVRTGLGDGVGTPVDPGLGEGVSFWRVRGTAQGPTPCWPDGREPLQVATALVTAGPQRAGLGFPVAAVAATAPPAATRPAARRLTAALVETVVNAASHDLNLRRCEKRWYPDWVGLGDGARSLRAAHASSRSSSRSRSFSLSPAFTC